MIRIGTDVVDGNDQDLKTRVRSYLLDRGVPNLRRIGVDADGGTVTLRGQVHSYYHKQLCIHCSRRVAGVMELIDQIEVV